MAGIKEVMERGKKSPGKMKKKCPDCGSTTGNCTSGCSCASCSE